jgi:hypothetical protein
MLQFGIIELLIILPRKSMDELTDFRFDYNAVRTGNRVVGLGERPYFDPASKSKAQALSGQ